MALYLEQKERDLIKNLLGEPKEFEFVKIGLLKKVLSDEERLDKIGECDHEYKDYVGKRHSCSKCSQLQREEWMAKELGL